MRGVKFYEEYTDGRKADSAGSVIAVDVADGSYFSDGKRCYQAVAGVFDSYPNPPVATTSVATEFLRERCKPITERRARRIHPSLFRFLDED